MSNINVNTNLAQKINQVGSLVGGVNEVIRSDQHINSLIQAAHEITSAEFVNHMTSLAHASQAGGVFNHMYEWGAVGDPNQKLWRHVLKGHGKNRLSYFEFKASKKTVPVDPELQAVGVKRIHVFVWKAMVLEQGIPVTITRDRARALVFLDRDPNHEAPENAQSAGFKKNGIVYHPGPIHVPIAGARITGSFKREYSAWWGSNAPDNAIRQQLVPAAISAITESFNERLAAMAHSGMTGTKISNKEITIAGVTPDRLIQQKLNETATRNYRAASRARRDLID